MYQKILVATDFSESSRAALRAAISLAKSCLASIVALHVDVARFPAFTTHGPERLLELQQRFDAFFPTELYPKCQKEIVAAHSVSKEILGWAGRHEVDLIVLGTHGHSAVESLLLGSVTQQLTQDSEIPVLVVHQFPGEETNFDRVLVPTDFTEASNAALDYAVRFANFLKADLHCVHVTDMPALEEGRTAPQSREMNVDLALEDTVERLHVEGKVVKATLSGDPVREILRYIESEQIDWVVMGTHQRKGLERILLGSVTAGVIAHTRVPALTISHPRQR